MWGNFGVMCQSILHVCDSLALVLASPPLLLTVSGLLLPRPIEGLFLRLTDVRLTGVRLTGVRLTGVRYVSHPAALSCDR